MGNTGDDCPETPKWFPGVCGCDESDADTDGDGLADCIDACKTDPVLSHTTADCQPVLPVADSDDILSPDFTPQPETNPPPLTDGEAQAYLDTFGPPIDFDQDVSPTEPTTDPLVAPTDSLPPPEPASTSTDSVIPDTGTIDANPESEESPAPEPIELLTHPPYVLAGHAAATYFECGRVFADTDPGYCLQCCNSFFENERFPKYSRSHQFCFSTCALKYDSLADDPAADASSGEGAPTTSVEPAPTQFVPPSSEPTPAEPASSALNTSWLISDAFAQTDGGSDPKNTGPTYSCLKGSNAAQGFQTLYQACNGCHTLGKKVRGGVSLFKLDAKGNPIIDRNGIKEMISKDTLLTASDLPVVTPGDPDSSALVYSITQTTKPVGSTGKNGIGSMPQNGAALSETAVDAVRAWIKDGFNDPGAAAVRTGQKYTEVDILKAVFAITENAEAADRGYLRFFYLPTYNDPVTDECAIQQLQALLSVTLNGLHWNKKMVYPKPADKAVIQAALPEAERKHFDEIDKVLFQIDLRDLWGLGAGKFRILSPLGRIAWSSIEQKGWWKYYSDRGIESDYPYNNSALFAFDYDAQAQRVTIRDQNWSLSKLALRAYYQTGSFVPYVRADWFVNETRRALYSQLLGLPGNSFELESALGVNVAKVTRTVRYYDPYSYSWKERKETIVAPIIGFDFVNNRLRRSGRTRSGVTVTNRIVDVHDTCIGGKYWISYDFKADADVRNIVSHPLGPSFWNVFKTNTLQKKLRFKNVFGQLYAYDASSGHYDSFTDAAFQQDGGEIIWTLPDGLHGYFVVNGLQEQLHEVPEEVAVSPSNPDPRDAERPVVNGLGGAACSRCHNEGIIEYEDNVQETKAKKDPKDDGHDRIRDSVQYKNPDKFFVLTPDGQYISNPLHAYYNGLYGYSKTDSLDEVLFFDYQHYYKYLTFKNKIDTLFAKLGDWDKREGELYELQVRERNLFLDAFKLAAQPFVGSAVPANKIGNLYAAAADRYFKDLDLNGIAAELGIADTSNNIDIAKLKDLAKKIPSIGKEIVSLTGSSPKPITRERLESSVLWRDLSKWFLLNKTLPSS